MIKPLLLLLVIKLLRTGFAALLCTRCCDIIRILAAAPPLPLLAAPLARCCGLGERFDGAWPCTRDRGGDADDLSTSLLGPRPLERDGDEDLGFGLLPAAERLFAATTLLPRCCRSAPVSMATTSPSSFVASPFS